jgi:hypothetical protein
MTNPAKKGNTPALKATKALEMDENAKRKYPSPSSKSFVVVCIGILGLVLVIVLDRIYMIQLIRPVGLEMKSTQMSLV